MFQEIPYGFCKIDFSEPIFLAFKLVTTWTKPQNDYGTSISFLLFWTYWHNLVHFPYSTSFLSFLWSRND